MIFFICTHDKINFLMEAPQTFIVDLSKDKTSELERKAILINIEVQSRKQKQSLLRGLHNIEANDKKENHKRRKNSNKDIKTQKGYIIPEMPDENGLENDSYLFPKNRPGPNRTVRLFGSISEMNIYDIKNKIQMCGYGIIEHAEHTFNYCGEYIGTHIVFREYEHAIRLIASGWYLINPFVDIKVVPRHSRRILTPKEKIQYQKELDNDIDGYMLDGNKDY